MASASGSPKVVGVVDESANTVSIGVVVGKSFLPVASAALDHAKARDLAAPSSSKSEPADEGGDE